MNAHSDYASARNAFGDVASATYVQLTTFTKAGVPKPAPIWAAFDRGELLMWTPAASWKVKRIRNTARVTLATCSARGNNVGPEVQATARLLDAAGTERARRAIIKKYGLFGRAIVLASSVFKGKSSTIGIAVTVP